jgi:hypothetical protein
MSDRDAHVDGLVQAVQANLVVVAQSFNRVKAEESGYPDWACIPSHGGATELAASVVVAWNDMTQIQWQLVAMMAGDILWEDTRKRAWQFFPPEGIKFIYNSGQLTAIRYILPVRPNCGSGYKGHGMTVTERMNAELFCIEVDDIEGPYVYEMKQLQP